MVEFADMTMGAMIGYVVSGTFIDVAYFDFFYQLIATVIIAKSIQENYLSEPQIGFRQPTEVTSHEAAIQLRV